MENMKARKNKIKERLIKFHRRWDYESLKKNEDCIMVRIESSKIHHYLRPM